MNLSKEAQTRLRAQAAALGMNIEDYAAKVLEGSATSQPTKMTGAELVEYWREAGVIGSLTDIKDSAAYARKLRRDAERRRA